MREGTTNLRFTIENAKHLHLIATFWKPMPLPQSDAGAVSDA
jgi:hypothetical protein